MGLIDSFKGMISGKKGVENRAQAQRVAQKVDEQAAKMGQRDGAGSFAEKAHETLDKIDGD